MSTSAPRSSGSSGSSWQRARWGACCVGWASAGYRCAPTIRARTPKPKRRLTNFAERAAAALPAAACGKPVEVWFQDEARVGQQGSLTYVWAEKGSRPPRPRDCRHASAWLFGAVCPARGVGAALAMPQVNVEAMSLHLAEISTQIVPGAQAVLVLDGAGLHQTGGRLRVPENTTLLPLPSYAPELNPVENVWEFLRSNLLSFQIWKTYEVIRDACCRAWNALLADPKRIRSITLRDWASVKL